MDKLKKEILEEFDKEINEDYLRGASTGSQLAGIKRFIAHAIDRVRKEERERCANIARTYRLKKHIPVITEVQQDLEILAEEIAREIEKDM